MNKLKVRVNAKINMTLDVVGSYKEGYHNLDMTMISVGIFDVVEVSLSDRMAENVMRAIQPTKLQTFAKKNTICLP